MLRGLRIPGDSAGAAPLAVSAAGTVTGHDPTAGTARAAEASATRAADARPVGGLGCAADAEPRSDREPATP
jgi:hypothetical protein